MKAPERQTETPTQKSALVPLEKGSAVGLPGEAPAKPAKEEILGGLSLDAASIWRAVKRHWLLILCLAPLAAGLVAGIAWVVIPVKLTATTLLRIESVEPSILFSAQESRANFLDYQRIQLAILKSRMLLNASLRKQKVAELQIVRQQSDPVEWLEKEIQADFKLAPEVLRISLSGTSADELTILVNAVRDTYITESVEKGRADRQKRLEQLKALASQYEEDLRTRRRTLKEIAQKVGSRDPQVASRTHLFAIERMALTERELFQVRSDLRKAQVEVANLADQVEDLNKTVVPKALVEEWVQKDKEVEKLTEDVATRKAAYERAKGLFVGGDQDPRAKKLLEDVEAARKALVARQDAIRPTLEEKLKEQGQQELVKNGHQLQARVNTLKKLEEQLDNEVKAMEQVTKKQGGDTMDLETIRDDIAQTEEVAKKVGAQIEALKVELQAPSRVKILEEAFVSSADGEKKRLRATAGAGLGGFALVLACVVWWELAARRVGSASEVRKGMGLKLMGVMPPLPSKQSSRLLSLGRGSGQANPRVMTEAADALRTMLLGAPGADGVRCVMITSASSGEGKTSLSTHLAASIARLGCRTLLVDADLRRPTLHQLFKLTTDAGLAEVLRGECKLGEAVQPIALDGLSVLPVGHADEASLRALAGARGRELFRRLLEEYDFVIVDSAPVLPVADSLVLGQYVDGVILSLLRDVSRAPAVLAAQERLEMLGIRILGAVVNGISEEVYGSRYYASPRPAAEHEVTVTQTV